MATSAHLSRTLGQPVTVEHVAYLASAIRSHDDRITDRAACALYVLARRGGTAEVKEIEAAVAARQGVIWALMKGLSVDLHLVEITGTGWTKAASLTASGKELVHLACALS